MSTNTITFIWPIRVYWEDTDAGGIVFYANYLKFMERARTEWLRSLGISQSELKHSTGQMFVVSRTDVRYLHPARLDDELRVSTEIIQKNRASLALKQEIWLSPRRILHSLLSNTEQTRDLHLAAKSHDHGSDKLVCQGTIEIAWVSAHSMKPCRIPAPILEKLS